MPTEKSASAVLEKTAEERKDDAFHYGVGRVLKQASITDPQEISDFYDFANKYAASKEAKKD